MRSIRRAPLVCTGLGLIVIMISLGSANDAYAVDFVLSNAASCTGLPGGGETWNAITSTCSKTANLNIVSGNTLTVTNGVTLEFPTNRDLINRGTVTNNGIINFSSGGDVTNRQTATFTNTGTIILNSTVTGTARLNNINDATFTNTNSGILSFDGPANGDAQIRNRHTADFTNSGSITIDGTSGNSGHLRNQIDAVFTNAASGTITITGNSGSSGRLSNQQSADFINLGTISIIVTGGSSGWLQNRDSSTLTNSGTITITGTNNNSGQLRNQNSASFTNSGTITVTGTNNSSGLVRNLSILTNSGTLTTNDGFNNNNANSDLTNSGTITITLNLNNNNGLIANNCGTITYGSTSGNTIVEGPCPPLGGPVTLTSLGSSSMAYEDPTIGKSHNGKQVVENGICIDVTCWTVTADYHQDFELVEILSDATHTISTTVFCHNGVSKCNYVAFGVSPYGTTISDSVWKIVLQKDHKGNWTMTIVDPEGYLGDVTSTTQIVNDEKHLSASITALFQKPTPGMILNVEVRDSYGGYRDFQFNDGIAIKDAFAYPQIEATYEEPIEVKPLCLNENPNKRYTCAFDKVREWTIKNAENALFQMK